VATGIEDSIKIIKMARSGVPFFVSNDKKNQNNFSCLKTTANDYFPELNFIMHDLPQSPILPHRPFLSDVSHIP